GWRWVPTTRANDFDGLHASESDRTRAVILPIGMIGPRGKNLLAHAFSRCSSAGPLQTAHRPASYPLHIRLGKVERTHALIRLDQRQCLCGGADGRCAIVSRNRGARAMPYKTILVHLNDKRRAEALLEPAIRLASRQDAHIVGINVHARMPAPP